MICEILILYASCVTKQQKRDQQYCISIGNGLMTSLRITCNWAHIKEAHCALGVKKPPSCHKFI